MKKIDTLVEDIYTLLSSGKVVIDTDHLAKMLGRRLSEDRSSARLRMSNFGQPCERKLWYSVNRPDTAEPLPPQVRLKFLYGDILEELVLSLAKQAGHLVEGEQDELDLFGVRGRRDGLVDKMVVDVKSANSRSFSKFKRNGLKEEDPFGYLDQIGLYHKASPEEDKDQEEVAFIAVDKELGYLALDKYPVKDRDWEKLVAAKRVMLASPVPPPRGFMPEPHNRSGNMKLPTACSYCPHKKTCWPQMRTFIYSSGPVYLTTVVKEPEVEEVKS